MSKFSSLLLGAVSGAAMFGAIQFASGSDLGNASLGNAPLQANASTISSAGPSISAMVDRSAKGDLAASRSGIGPGPDQTLSFKVHSLTDTSVVVRVAGSSRSGMPAAKESGTSRAIPAGPAPRRATVACEPPVSMLTDVAKVIQPGRCVT